MLTLITLLLYGTYGVLCFITLNEYWNTLSTFGLQNVVQSCEICNLGHGSER